MLPFSLTSVLDEIARQELLVGVFLAGAGLMFLVMGLRLSRMLVALSFGIVGFVLGGSLPVPGLMRLLLAVCMGIGLAGASLFVVRPAVAVLAGFWTGLVAMTFLSEMQVNDQIVLILSVFAFAGGASLALVVFEEVIAFVTSLEGTLLFLGGLVIFMNQSPMLWSHIRSLLVSNNFFAPFLVLAGTTTGFYLQLAELQKKRVGMSV